jgi:hypothetical protein
MKNFIPKNATIPMPAELPLEYYKEEYFAVVMIPVGSKRDERDIIRSTWMKYNNVFHPTRNPGGTVRRLLLSYFRPQYYQWCYALITVIRLSYIVFTLFIRLSCFVTHCLRTSL